MASRRASMQAGNKLAAIAKMLEAGHTQLAQQYAHPALLYFGGFAGDLPQAEIAQAVTDGDSVTLMQISAELIAQAVDEP